MRSPAALLSRFARQMLVDGVELSGQMRLSRAAVAIAGDGSPFAAAAAEAAARYLVGAGVGAVAAAEAADWDLCGLDPQVRLLQGVSEATPPLASIYLAARPYGASVDIIIIDHSPGWAEGRSPAARVATLRFDFGCPAGGAEAIIVGTATADLVLGDLLALAAMPDLRLVRWRPDGEPQVCDQQAEPTVEVAATQHADETLLAELAASTAAAAAIVADAKACYPLEACGLIVRHSDGLLRTLSCENQQDRYHEQDPAAWPRTARVAFRLNELEIARAAQRNETLVGIYHSHSDAGAYFSAEDARCAAPEGQPLYPGVAHLVVSVIGGTPQAAAMYHFDPATGAWLPEAGHFAL